MNNEQDILRRAQQGDSEAFRLLVEAYEDTGYTSVWPLRMCGRSGGRRRDQEAFRCAWRATSGVPRYLPLLHMALPLTTNAANRLAPPRSAIGAWMMSPSWSCRMTAPPAGTRQRRQKHSGPSAVRAGSAVEEHRQNPAAAVYAGAGLCRDRHGAGDREGTMKSHMSRAKMRLRELLDGKGNLLTAGPSYRQRSVKGGSSRDTAALTR